MIHSESRSELFKALVKAQSEFKTIPFDKINPHFKNKYASLSSTIEMIRPILGQNGLAILQSVESENSKWSVETKLIHSSGEFISTTVDLIIVKHDMQGLGSAVTYAKRYAIQALLCITGDDDDDGNQASKNSSTSSNSENPSISSNSENPTTKKEYPKVAPRDFVLNLGSIKDIKLGELSNEKLVSIGAWLSSQIKNKPQDKKTKYYGFVYSQVKKVLELSQKPDFIPTNDFDENQDNETPPPDFDDPIMNYAQNEQSYAHYESGNPFDAFVAKKKNYEHGNPFDAFIAKKKN